MNINNSLILDYDGQLWNESPTGKNINEDILQAKENGYDGVIVKNVRDVGATDLKKEEIPPSTVIVAFNSEQVKSATDNRGTFDANNPDIYYQEQAPASPAEQQAASVSATEAVDDYNAQMEDYNLKQTAREYVDTVAKLIRQNGGLRLEDFIHDVGEEAAKELRKKWPGLFRNTTQGPQIELDVLTETLKANGINLDVRGLVDWLRDTLNEKPAKPTPPALTADTLKAAVEKYGAETASQYLNERKRYLEGLARKEESPDALRALTKELRAIDRVIAGEKAAKARNALKEHYQEWIRRLRAERDVKVAAERQRGHELAEKVRAQGWERLEKLRARYNAMAEQKRARKKLGQEIDKTVRSINRMADTESISYDRQQEIKQMLNGYDLRRRSRKTMERRAEIETLLDMNYLDAQDAREMNEAELAFLGITRKDLKYLGATTLNDMTLADLKELQAQVGAVFEQGKAEFEAWQAGRQERREKYRSGLQASLDKKKGPEPTVVGSNKDLGKQYKGIRGKLEKAKDVFYSETMTPDRFFDWLDSGGTKYDGAFVQYFVDALNAAENEAKQHERERLDRMNSALRELGFKMSDFSKKAADAAGRSWTWNEIMELYVGMRNEKKARAILFGNFVNGNGQGPVMSVEQAQATIRELVGKLSPEHRQAAELVVQDHDANFERINRKFIEAFNKGMEQELDYSSIHRLEHQTRQGLIDVEDEAAMTHGMDNAAIMKRVETGFMQNRQEIADEHQVPIMLGLFSNWMNDVSRHEHSAAMAQIAGDLASAMLTKGEEGRPLMRQLSDKFGKGAARTLANFFDDSVTDGQRLASDYLDSLSSKMARNMSVAYIAGNCGTVMKQLTSIPRFLITAGPMRLTLATSRFLANPQAFLARAYALDSQLAARGGNALMNAVLRDSEWGKAAYQRGLEWMFRPVSVVDRWVAAIGWVATYEANLEKGATKEQAIREAQRAVRLTQQAASAKDLPRFWRSGGYVKTVMAFTSDTAATLGMTAYDMVQQLTSGEWNTTKKAFSTALALAVTAICMKAAKDGISGDDDDDEEGGPGAWLASALTEEFITSLPLIGKEAMMLYEELSGKYRGTTYSAFLTPVVKLLKGLDLLTDEDSEEEQYWRASGMLLDSLALSGIAPIPSTAIRRVVQSVAMMDEGDVGNAARTLFGMRVRRDE
ncbi:MAG: hypothetical protein K5841_03775 [Fretibacterium sp.]|nr:hypothetical protein [Fretibacterium sp.]